jgi:hypothetical protein
MAMLNDVKLVSFYKKVPDTINYLKYCQNIELIADFFDIPNDCTSVTSFKLFKKQIKQKNKKNKPF